VALPNVVVFFVLALAALFLLILLTGLLATLTGLAALLAGLIGLSTLLSRLPTLLFVLLHIVCHEIVLPLDARLGAPAKSTTFV
jgi:hypothetical protein